MVDCGTVPATDFVCETLSRISNAWTLTDAAPSCDGAAPLATFDALFRVVELRLSHLLLDVADMTTEPCVGCVCESGSVEGMVTDSDAGFQFLRCWLIIVFI